MASSDIGNAGMGREGDGSDCKIKAPSCYQIHGGTVQTVKLNAPPVIKTTWGGSECKFQELFLLIEPQRGSSECKIKNPSCY